MLRLSAYAALAVLALAACDSSGTPGEPSVEQEAVANQPASVAKPNPSFQPFAFTVDNCVETVALEGTFHEVSRFFIGPSGKAQLKFHINAKGIGVGQLTGARYQWNDRLFDMTNLAPRGTVSFIQSDFTRLIGQGGVVNTVLKLEAKITVNAKGVVTVDRFTIVDGFC
jgi:hypothetical protein